MPTHTTQTSPTDNVPQVIDTQDELDALAPQLMSYPVVAIDTEANSFYAYREQVCLVQISIPGTDYLVDPLALDDLSPLAPFFDSLEVEKIFHAVDYDLMMLRRDFGFVVRNIFDTMWAARILGWPKVGLADILDTYFDVRMNKRYQRYNWGKRPLDPEALRYAWMDSHYLLDLREIQKEELQAAGRWEEAREVFRYLTTTVEVPPEDTTARHFWRIKGVHKMPPRERRVLFQLYLWRERAAEALDRPPFKVLPNGRLVRIARAQPRNKAELASLGLSPWHVRHFGGEILKALRDDHLPEPPSQPHQGRPPDDVLDRFHTLKAWRKEVAKVRGVDSDVILPNAVLWELARRPPDDLEELLDVTGIGPWRQANYGPDLLQLVAD
ncbi:MAG: ribonuclease D [Anaerolineae bacterium]